MADIDVEKLKLQLFSINGDEQKEAYNALCILNMPELTEEVFQQALACLELNNSHNLERDAAAYLLRYINDNRAVEPLFNAILKKENIRYNGSLVYALEKLDCRYKFNELFEILFYHGGIAKLSAYSILCDQEFAFNHKDLLSIKEKWEDLLLHPEKSPEFSDEKLKNMIQDRVEAFVCYLNEPDI